LDRKELIAYNIAELRKYLGLTQSELAEKLNYSDKAVSKWERGESLPDILVLAALTDMCDLPLDYLIEDHSGEKLKPENPHKRRNHIIITLLSVALVWLVAILAVVIIKMASQFFSSGWIIYVCALIASEIVVLIFNSIWGNTKLNYIIITVLMWTALAAFYFIFPFAQPNVFLLGIPGQIIIIFWSTLYFRKNKKQ